MFVVFGICYYTTIDIWDMVCSLWAATDTPPTEGFGNSWLVGSLRMLQI